MGIFNVWIEWNYNEIILANMNIKHSFSFFVVIFLFISVLLILNLNKDWVNLEVKFVWWYFAENLLMMLWANFMPFAGLVCSQNLKESSLRLNLEQKKFLMLEHICWHWRKSESSMYVFIIVLFFFFSHIFL